MSNPATSSGRITASAAISLLPGKLKSVIAEGDGTNAATIIVYDSLAASGNIVAKIVVKAGNTFEFFESSSGVIANTALYLALSGTGAAAIVHYEIS